VERSWEMHSQKYLIPQERSLENNLSFPVEVSSKVISESPCGT
jgi:hypothetical protein